MYMDEDFSFTIGSKLLHFGLRFGLLERRQECFPDKFSISLRRGSGLFHHNVEYNIIYNLQKKKLNKSSTTIISASPTHPAPWPTSLH